MTVRTYHSQKSHISKGRDDVIMKNKKPRRPTVKEEKNQISNQPVLVFGLILVQPKLITGKEEQLQICPSLDHL